MDDPGPASARYIERALKAIQGDKDAARDVETYSKKLSEARRAQHAAGYDLIIACGFTDVARMWAFLAAPDERRVAHASIKKFVAHVETSLDGNNGVLTTFERNVKYFWKLLEKHGQKIYAGAGLNPEDFVTKDWEKLRGNSHVAERRGIQDVLRHLGVRLRGPAGHHHLLHRVVQLVQGGVDEAVRLRGEPRHLLEVRHPARRGRPEGHDGTCDDDGWCRGRRRPRRPRHLQNSRIDRIEPIGGFDRDALGSR